MPPAVVTVGGSMENRGRERWRERERELEGWMDKGRSHLMDKPILSSVVVCISNMSSLSHTQKK